MSYRYTTKKGVFEANDLYEIPWDDLHSLNDEPAWENLSNGDKIWFFEGKYHRETGPARIYSSDGYYGFCLNDIIYRNVNDWLLDNPNKDKVFQVKMILQYS